MGNDGHYHLLVQVVLPSWMEARPLGSLLNTQRIPWVETTTAFQRRAAEGVGLGGRGGKGGKYLARYLMENA